MGCHSISNSPVWRLLMQVQHRMEGKHPSSNQYQYLSDVSNSWGMAMQQLGGSSCCGFTASKNTSRQCHYFAFKPAMLSAMASPFTAFPLQIHRSLRKVKKAGPVYFGRWNIFWKSNTSAIFSFRWLRQQREPRSGSVNSLAKVQHDRGDAGDHMIAAIPESIDKIF